MTLIAISLPFLRCQDQFHSSQSDKWASKADPTTGWNGVTKATPLKEYPAEEPNRTKPEDVIKELKSNSTGKEVSVNVLKQFNWKFLRKNVTNDAVTITVCLVSCVMHRCIS